MKHRVYILLFEILSASNCIFPSLADAEKTGKTNDGSSRSEPRTGRALSLSDILYRSEANSDASHDGPGSEREDSDYDEELELDFETSISGDEGRDNEPNILHGSLNLRIHRRGDSTRETSCTNGSCGSPSSSQTDRTPYQVSIQMFNRGLAFCFLFLFSFFFVLNQNRFVLFTVLDFPSNKCLVCYCLGKITIILSDIYGLNCQGVVVVCHWHLRWICCICFLAILQYIDAKHLYQWSSWYL